MLTVELCLLAGSVRKALLSIRTIKLFVRSLHSKHIIKHHTHTATSYKVQIKLHLIITIIIDYLWRPISYEPLALTKI